MKISECYLLKPYRVLSRDTLAPLLSRLPRSVQAVDGCTTLAMLVAVLNNLLSASLLDNPSEEQTINTLEVLLAVYLAMSEAPPGHELHVEKVCEMDHAKFYIIPICRAIFDKMFALIISINTLTTDLSDKQAQELMSNVIISKEYTRLIKENIQILKCHLFDSVTATEESSI